MDKDHGGTALITGVTGQDGAYLAAFLLARGYRVHGLVRRDVLPAAAFFEEEPALLRAIEAGDFRLHEGDVTDAHFIIRLVGEIKPREIYNLAALSHVASSFETPSAALAINTQGTLNLLEGIRLCGLAAHTRFYQASSSEMFGGAPAPQNEETPMHPRSPYGVAKLAAYWMARTYRESYGVFAANGILFNHESPRRGHDFVTQKIIRGAVAASQGDAGPLLLGNMEARRDWGHARDYVRGMHAILQQDKADDFVLATGVSFTVREFTERAFAQAGIKLRWRGAGVDETGVQEGTQRVLVRIDPALFRPLEVSDLLGDAAKAQRVLGWRPEYDLDALIADMLRTERGRRLLVPGGTPWRKTG